MFKYEAKFRNFANTNNKQTITLVTLASRRKQAARSYLCLYSGGENMTLPQSSVEL